MHLYQNLARHFWRTSRVHFCNLVTSNVSNLRKYETIDKYFYIYELGSKMYKGIVNKERQTQLL
jgi:hypothetical protein